MNTNLTITDAWRLGEAQPGGIYKGDFQKRLFTRGDVLKVGATIPQARGMNKIKEKEKLDCVGTPFASWPP